MDNSDNKNRKDRKEYHRLYYLAKREKHAEQMRRWYSDNKELVSERGAKWYKENRPAICERRKERFEVPSLRMRRLSYDAKRRAKKGGFAYDDSFVKKLEQNPPDRCACCGVEIDYSLGKIGYRSDMAPSFDKIDPSCGYVDGNVKVICFRCNRLKSNASIEDMETVLSYMRRHLLQNAPFKPYVIQPQSCN